MLDPRCWMLDAGCWISSGRESRIQHRKPRIESGFTLIEVMVATVITMMIIGSVYAAFRSSLNVYQRDETRIIMLQRCRAALDRMARDIGNLFYVADDEELVIMSEDFADSETGADKDMLTFVTIVEPRLEDYYLALEESESSLTEEEENPLPSDLARIVYYIGTNPEDETVESLMRIQTTNLDNEELEELLEELMTSPSEEMLEELRSSILVDYIAGLNIRYFDGEDWIDVWDMEEEGSIPSAVELTLSITDADTQEKTLTEAVVVNLPLYEPPTEETETQMGGMGQ
jgi:prepilin-type N-terminal cleavage/methylation domain-containing protein